MLSVALSVLYLQEALASLDLCASHGVSSDPMPVRNEENRYFFLIFWEIEFLSHNTDVAMFDPNKFKSATILKPAGQISTAAHMPAQLSDVF